MRYLAEHSPTARRRLALSLALLLTACGGGSNGSGSFFPFPGVTQPDTGNTKALAIKTLSNRADLVSDGDVLTEIVVPEGVSSKDLKVTVNGQDRSAAFSQRADGRTIGLLDGLAVGKNDVVATLANARSARLTITNASRAGALFAGAFPGKFHCATPVPRPTAGNAPATNASGLGGQPDADCNIATEFKLYYKSTTAGCTFDLPDPSPAVAPDALAPAASAPPPANPCFKTYDPAAARPADMASTTNDAGLQVPYIVRVERGTMNRGIYDIAVLFDPARPWTATDPQKQWNRKVYYQFGASTGNPRRQVRPTPAWTLDMALSRGFVVAQNSMSDSGTNSNKILSTETVMKMKEHIADTYGEVLYTHGTGCSGGAINSHTTMSVTPGLIDGFTVSCTFADLETTFVEVADCALLTEAYQKPAWLALMATGNGGGAFSQTQVNEAKAAINGHRDQTACQAWFTIQAAGVANMKPGNYFPRLVLPTDEATGKITEIPVAKNNCELPAAAVYDPVSNPSGPRCGIWDWAASVFGQASDGIRTLETRDNVGVQYGLKALLDDKISGELFVTLNEIVGGVDKDTNLVASRSTADTAAIETAYRSGLVANGAQIARHPQIDLRGYDDSLIDLPPALGTVLVGVHHNWRSFSVRDRLDRDGAGHVSHALWRFGRNGFAMPPGDLSTDALLVMDNWLLNIKADKRASPIEKKIADAKPASAADFCLLSSDATQSVKVTDTAACDADPYLKFFSSPRQVAGGPRTEDVLKCQLRPIDASAYGGRLSPPQLARLQAVFTGGVCDWRKPGVGQQVQGDVPLNFNAGPGGKPLPAAPVSTAL